VRRRTTSGQKSPESRQQGDRCRFWWDRADVWGRGDPGKSNVMATTDSSPPLTEPRLGDAHEPGDQSVLGGRYRLDEEVGRGGMAVVHRGVDLVLGRNVAIKVFRSDGDETDTARYEHEARVLASLNNTGLVTVFDAGVDASDSVLRPFLVMEYVAGATLADVLHDGPLEASEVARLGAEVATALAYAHRHGVVHRDVKPANILLPAPEDGEPADRLDAKLTDFGIARLVDGARITTMNRRLGTVAYLSPEQVRGTDVGPASDVYSLGLVLLECLTGATVFPGDGVEAAAARLHEPPQLPTVVPSDWGRLLRDMLDLEPERRPTAAEVSVTLTGLMMAPPAVQSVEAAAVATGVAAEAAGANDANAHATTVVPRVDLDETSTAAPDLGPHATRVLDIPQELLAPRRGPWHRQASFRLPAHLPLKLIGFVLAGLVAFLLIAAIAGPLHTPSYARPPAYPTVPGKLGTDLVTLQEQVRQ
jgi:hypothetical protein